MLGDKRQHCMTVSRVMVFAVGLAVLGCGKEGPPPSRSQTSSCFVLRSHRREVAIG